jgi:general secretion pathway protein I
MANILQKKVSYNESMNARSGGFTLIEVLVALTIIAISLGAILSTSGTQANQVAHLKQKTIAHWVAMNEITKLQIEKKFPSPGKTKGSTKMANNEWFWERTIINTEEKNARQVEFKIFLEEKNDNSLVHLIGFVGK